MNVTNNQTLVELCKDFVVKSGFLEKYLGISYEVLLIYALSSTAFIIILIWIISNNFKKQGVSSTST